MKFSENLDQKIDYLNSVCLASIEKLSVVFIRANLSTGYLMKMLLFWKVKEIVHSLNCPYHISNSRDLTCVTYTEVQLVSLTMNIWVNCIKSV